MIDLGRHAFEIGVSYGVALILLAGIVGLSVFQARRVNRQLDEAEARWSND